MPVASTDTSRIQRWLRSRLGTLSLPVYRGQAPEGATFPCVIFRRQGGVDITTLRDTAMIRSVWLVFVAGKGNFQAESQQAVNVLEAHADAMHAAINKPEITEVSGRLIHELRRESEFYDPVVENGVEYQRIGGTYLCYSTLA